jgi:hypothetical protein
MLTKQQSWTNVRERVTLDEWEQRVALASVYRLVAHFRWDDLIFTIYRPAFPVLSIIL